MDKYISVFKALSDKTRIRILHLLLKAKCELCICEIMGALKIAQYNVSKHIKELKIAGLVKERKEKRFTFCSINKQNEKFYNIILKSIDSIDEKYFLNDNRSLKLKSSIKANRH